MRKITSAKDLEGKRKRNNLILGLILVGVMVFGTLGYAFEGRDGRGGGENANKFSYNGFEFVKQEDFWITQISELQFIFKYNPKEAGKNVENLSVLKNYYQKPLYIYSEDDSASLEITRNMKYFVQRIQKACIEEKDCKDNIPLKTCTDNFIIIKESTEIKLEQKDRCVFIEGSKDELAKLSDEFLFKLFEIN